MTLETAFGGCKIKRLHVRSAIDDDSFQVAAYDGADSMSLLQAVAARLGTAPGSIFFTVASDANATLVPLSAALPDGFELTVHIRQPADDLSSAGSTFQEVVGGAAGVPRQSSGADNSHAADTSPPRTRATSSAAATATDTHGGRSKGGISNHLAYPLMSSSVTGSEADVELNRATQTPPGPKLSQRLRRILRRNENTELEAAPDSPSAELVSAMERFSRLATDLANERTLLAWIRTGLAAMRTIFPFYSMNATTALWATTLITSQVMMAIYVLVLAFTGYHRYHLIKKLLMLRQPPEHFGRTSLRYSMAVLAVSSAVVAVGVCSRTWVK